MRKEFARCLYEQMQKNQSIVLLSGDLGFGLWDKIMEDYPDRFINTGAAEVSLITIAVGLALEGKIPFCYSISPFLIYRPFEAIKSYINGESIPVKLIGSGQTEQCYSHEGPSHASWDIPYFLDGFANIAKYYPEEREEIPDLVQTLIDNNAPSVMLLRQK